MALGKDTQERIAAVYPNCHHLLPEFEKACTIIKYDNAGKSEVRFTATGLDRCGRVIVKCFDVMMHLFRHNDDDEKYIG